MRGKEMHSGTRAIIIYTSLRWVGDAQSSECAIEVLIRPSESPALPIHYASQGNGDDGVKAQVRGA